jgi:3-hydroxybutyryl-CoA dehydrogenase
MAALRSEKTVGVVGCGAMGAGIAQVAAAAGHRVLIHDVRAGAAARAVDDIGAAWQKLVSKNRMRESDVDAARARLHVAATLADLADCALVIEAVAEDIDIKRALFAELETLTGDDCLFATNTSSLSVTAIAALLLRPQRLAGMHFFNPAPLMALVEVVSGMATDAAVAQAIHDTAAAWGKHPVHTKSTPGFIVNRVARPFYAEGMRLLGEGAADAATIDAVLREAGGFRMGPFELMDLIGHDVNFAVTRSVWQAYFGDGRFTPSVIQRELVDAGYLGRKSGRGFYDYAATAPKALARSEAMQPPPQKISCGGGPAVAAIAARLRQAGVNVERHEDAAPALICDGAFVYLTDGRTATQRARDDWHDDTVLFDLACDYATAPRIAIACADQCGASAVAAVTGLFQAAGFTVSRLDDVAGMAVMRTVAMLANEAADAVNQGVCSVAAVDEAMQKGVNYPRGPLAWADVIGIEGIVAVLDNLAAVYGEERYRVSPLLRRKRAAAGRFYA